MNRQQLLQPAKPLSYLRCLKNVSDECLFPSRSKARIHFRQQKMHGKLDLVTLEYQEQEYAFWRLCLDQNLYSFLAVFNIPNFTPDDLDASDPIIISPNSLFISGQKAYRPIRQNHDLIIKEVTMYPTENTLNELEYEMGEEFTYIHPVLVYRITPAHKFLTAAWYCENIVEDISLIPIFTESKNLLEEIGFDNLNYEFLDVNNSFNQNGTRWIVMKNLLHGWHITPSCLQIGKKNSET